MRVRVYNIEHNPLAKRNNRKPKSVSKYNRKASSLSAFEHGLVEAILKGERDKASTI